MINCTEHKGKLEFIKRIPRTHTRGKGPVRFVLRIDGYRVITKPYDPIINKIPDLVGKECIAVIGVWRSINVIGSVKLASEVTSLASEVTSLAARNEE